MALVKNNIYHSFPRVDSTKSRKEQIDEGLKIIESMKEIGILCTPDYWEFKQKMNNGTSNPISIAQNSFCATCIPFENLNSHMIEFGLFSLEFTIESFKDLGGNPVFYCDSNESMISEVIAQFVVIQNIFKLSNDLINIQKDKINIDEPVFVTKNGINTDISFTKNEIEIFEKIINSLIEPKYYNLSTFYNTIKNFSSLFIPLDSYKVKNVDNLKYYQQNEWRILSNLKIEGLELATSLNEEQKNILKRNFLIFQARNIKPIHQGRK